MRNEKLLEIITELKKQGKTEDQIREILDGYDVDLNEVNENLKKYTESRASLNQSIFPENYLSSGVKKEEVISKEDKPSPKKFSLKPFLIIFIIIIVGLVVFFIFSNNSLIPALDDGSLDDQNTFINDQNNTSDQNTSLNNDTNTSDQNTSTERVINLGIDFLKESYLVGDSLEGSKYTFSYQGDSFKGRIIYSKSIEGSGTVSYSSLTGMISNGSFDDSLAFLRHSMYTLNSDMTPNPFACDGEYTYSISVYSCEDIDDAMNTDDCGNAGSPPTIKTESIVMQVEPLDSLQKTISVACPDGSTDCCLD